MGGSDQPHPINSSHIPNGDEDNYAVVTADCIPINQVTTVVPVTTKELHATCWQVTTKELHAPAD